MTDGEFSVHCFFPDEWHECIAEFVSAQDAVLTAKRESESDAAQTGRVCRIIITDGGDFTVFEWKFGQGVTFPPRDASGRFVHVPD